MIYQFKKYKDIADFIRNKPKSTISESYTILHKCMGVDVSDEYHFNNQCFACLFCVNSKSIQASFLKFWNNNLLDDYATSFFSGIPVKLPLAKKALRVPYRDLNQFTSKCETTNIQPWLAGILTNLSSDINARISMEVPVFNLAYDRNGRLDVCVMSNQKLLVVETKTTLDDTLSDERFVEQHQKYTEEIEKYTKDYIYLTVIGGNETDLYPDNSYFSTSQQGNKAKRFYRLLTDNNIKFSSPAAIWGMYCKFMLHGLNYSWDNFLYNILKDKKCIGLLSAGAVKSEQNTVTIENIEII